MEENQQNQAKQEHVYNRKKRVYNLIGSIGAIVAGTIYAISVLVSLIMTMVACASVSSNATVSINFFGIVILLVRLVLALALLILGIRTIKKPKYWTSRDSGWWDVPNGENKALIILGDILSAIIVVLMVLAIVLSDVGPSVLDLVVNIITIISLLIMTITKNYAKKMPDETNNNDIQKS